MIYALFSNTVEALAVGLVPAGRGGPGWGRGGKGPVPVRGRWDGPGPPSGTHLRPVAAAASLVIGGMCVCLERGVREGQDEGLQRATRELKQ